MVSRVVAAIVNMAMIQPGPAIRNCISGEKTNWPKEPPALMKPEAKGRRAAGRRWAVAPIRIEKLPAPAPAAESTPMVSSRPHSELTNGVAARPPASSSAPSTITRAGPYLSAMAPKMGCEAPHMNWPMASAKLIVATPRPVAVFRGDRNRPVVRRAPMVIIRIALAARIRSQAARGDISVWVLIIIPLFFCRVHTHAELG